MGTYFTDLTNGQLANATTFNAPLDGLDAELVDINNKLSGVTTFSPVIDGTITTLACKFAVSGADGLQLNRATNTAIRLNKIVSGSATGLYVWTDNEYRPEATGTIDLGGPSFRWNTVYSTSADNISSDASEKTIIGDVPANKAYDAIKAMPMVVFTRNDDPTGARVIATTAQDIEAGLVNAGVVTVEQLANYSIVTTDADTGAKGVAYNDLFCLNIVATQEAIDRLENLATLLVSEGVITATQANGL